MNIIELSLFISLVISACGTSEETQNKDLDDFLRKFEIAQSPKIIINEEMVFSKTYKTYLDSLELERFVEKNRLIRNNSMYDFFRYYPLQVVSYNSFYSILVLKRGGAGAFDDRVILITLDLSGKIISSLRVANKLGDCSTLNMMEVEIEDKRITMKKSLKKLNCGTEEVLSNQNETIKYAISEMGVISKKE